MDEGDAQLKQFDVLWAEIARRSNAQQALIALNVTITGTLVGIVVSGRAVELLVVLAVVSPGLGLLWVDHARNIGDIAVFIRKNWEKTKWGPSWEEHSEDTKGRDRRRFWFFVTAMIIVFAVPAFAGLVASVSHLSGGIEIAGWIAALTLTALFSVALASQALQTRPPRRQSSEAPASEEQANSVGGP